MLLVAGFQFGLATCWKWNGAPTPCDACRLSSTRIGLAAGAATVPMRASIAVRSATTSAAELVYGADHSFSRLTELALVR